MEEPKTLLMVGPEGDVYNVTNYENIKTSMELQYSHEQFLEVLKMWYIELAFTYRFDSTMQELINMGAIKKNGNDRYELSDIHNSLNFIRTKVVHELGNSALSNLNMQVENKWKQVEKQANEIEKNKDRKE